MAQPISEIELSLGVLRFEPRQSREFGINTSLLNDKRIAGGNGLYFSVGEGCAVHIFNPPQVTFTGHHLRDKLRFRLQGLPHIGVKRALRDVAINLHFRVRVSLAKNWPSSLLTIGGRPRSVE